MTKEELLAYMGTGPTAVAPQPVTQQAPTPVVGNITFAPQAAATQAYAPPAPPPVAPVLQAPTPQAQQAPGWTRVTTPSGNGSTTIDVKQHPGRSFEGRYLGNREITTKIGPNKIFEFSTDDGKAFSVYGFTGLNRSMEQVPVNAVVRITYTGTAPINTKYGRKNVHQVNVEMKA